MTVTCDNCRQTVVDGVYCTRCGAHQGTTTDLKNSGSRRHSYAAHPGEHVAHPGLFTTLFPHLGQHKVHEFRWALMVGLAGVFVLYVAGLITAALLASAFLVPVLYLIYLYEVQVYKDEPAVVLGFTLAGGAVLGIALTLIVNTFGPTPLAGLHGGVDWVALVLLAIALPIIQEVLKPLPALLLRGRGFDETIDGLVFGVAAGLGFSLAESIINFSAVISSTGFRTDPGNWIYPLVTVAVLQPVMQGSATGLLVASLWRPRGGRSVLGVAAALFGHVLFSLGSSLIREMGTAQLVILAWQAMVVGGLLVAIRYHVHHALLEEAADRGLSETLCSHCLKHVMAAGFCPSCGLALSAAPRSVKARAVAVTTTEGT